MRFAYADPPYPGMAHMYKDHPDFGGEVDHKKLIERLMSEFPDGWALSTASCTLKEVLALCPDDVRTLIWVTPDSKGMPGTITPSYQPCIMRGGRRRPGVIRDVLWCSQRPAGEREINFTGGKPEQYNFWVFRCFGAVFGDELVDLFPGSGAVTRAWDKYQRQIALPLNGEREKQTRLMEVARAR